MLVQKKIEICVEKLLDRKDIFCHLLSIKDGDTLYKVVIDVGIDSTFDYKMYSPKVKKIIESADGILLTSFDSKHFGAVGLFPEQLIYCTVPTAVLGTGLLKNAKEKAEQTKLAEVLDETNLTMVKYAQPFEMSSLEISAYNAGTTLGNSIYKIKYKEKTVAIGYDINHKKDNWLNGFSNFFQADVFITNTSYAQGTDEILEDTNKFLSSVALRKDTKVIFVVNASRLIDLLLSIKKNVCVVTNLNFMDRVKSMVEWMGDDGMDFVGFKALVNKPNEITTDCIIIIDDYINSVYLGSVLSQFRESGVDVIYLNRIKDDEMGKMKTKKKTSRNNLIPEYKISYKKVKIEPKIKTEEEVEEVEEIIDQNAPWYEVGDTLILNGKISPALRFRKFKPLRIIENYGEAVDFKFEPETAPQEIKHEALEQEIEVEMIEKIGDVELSKPTESNFLAVASLDALNYIVEEMGSPKVVLLDDNTLNNMVMTSYLSKLTTVDFQHCLKKASLTFELKHNKTKTLVDNIKAEKMFWVGNKHLDIQKVKVENDEVKIISNVPTEVPVTKPKSTKKTAKVSQPVPKRICLTEITIEKLKELLIDNGYETNLSTDCLTVEKKCKIKMDNDQFTFQCEDFKLLSGIREIFYKNSVLFDF